MARAKKIDPVLFAQFISNLNQTKENTKERGKLIREFATLIGVSLPTLHAKIKAATKEGFSIVDIAKATKTRKRRKSETQDSMRWPCTSSHQNYELDKIFESHVPRYRYAHSAGCLMRVIQVNARNFYNNVSLGFLACKNRKNHSLLQKKNRIASNAQATPNHKQRKSLRLSFFHTLFFGRKPNKSQTLRTKKTKTQTVNKNIGARK